MTEPRIDPKFPDRPQHEDFWTLSEAVRTVDSLADKGLSAEDVLILSGIDLQSVFYMAQQRALRLIRNTPTPQTSEELMGAMASMWIDGLLAGRKFAQTSSPITLDDSIDGNRRRGKENNK